MEAIVYTSNTGNTKMYAKLLSDRIKLPFYSLEEAKTKLISTSKIIYLGWNMASTIKGYKEASTIFVVVAACAVGMGGTGTQVEQIRKKNKIPISTEVFSLQGGFDINKLQGKYKLMMNIMLKTAGKALKNKTNRTEEENIMFEMMFHGGSCVSNENLENIVHWYRYFK